MKEFIYKILQVEQNDAETSPDEIERIIKPVTATGHLSASENAA